MARRNQIINLSVFIIPSLVAFADHWRSMAVGIACTSFFLFVILVACFLKIASNRRFAGLEQTTSQTELNPTDSIVESTFSNDINESLLE